MQLREVPLIEAQPYPLRDLVDLLFRWQLRHPVVTGFTQPSLARFLRN